MIFTPVILPPIPNPTASECETLISYFTKAISGLETVEDRLNEVSYNPDEGIMAIRQKVSEMLSEARNTKSQLEIIKSNAYEKMNLYNQSQNMA